MKPVLGSTIWIESPVALRKPRSTLPALAVTHWRANGPPPVSDAMNVSLRASYMRAELTHVYLSAKSRACGFGQRDLVPRVALVDRVAERVLGHERLLLAGPVVVVGRAHQDPDREVDLDQVRRDQLAVEHEAGRHEPRVAPLVHVRVAVVDDVRVVERAPADQVRAAVADLLVPRQRLVEEVVEVVVHGHGALAVVDVAHQAHVVLRQRLLRDVGAAAARQDRRRVRVAAAEQAVHLARVAGHLQRLQVELARERVERAHDVGDRLVAVDARRAATACSPPWPGPPGWSP